MSDSYNSQDPYSDYSDENYGSRRTRSSQSSRYSLNGEERAQQRSRVAARQSAGQRASSASSRAASRSYDEGRTAGSSRRSSAASNNGSAQRSSYSQGGTRGSSRDQIQQYSRYGNAYGDSVSGGRGRRSNEYDDYALSQSQARRGRKRKIILIVVIALLVVALGAGIALAVYANNISQNLHQGVTEEVEEALVETEYSEEPFYMLLLGTDESEERDQGDYGGSFRSDSMMLARIDCVNKKVTLVSLERDTLVDMGEYGMQKLNAASNFGGPAYAIEKVSELAGVGISHFATVDFDGFCSVVDALGGIEVDVPIEIDDEDAGGHLDAGLQTLNGEQALILCRSRNAYENYGSGNTYRSANQRLVLSAIAQKILDSDVATIANTVSALSEYVTTDLELTDIIGIAQSLKGLDMETDMLTAMQPTESVYEDGLWYNVTVEPDWTNMMQRVDQGLSPTTEDVVDSASGTILASTGSGDAFAAGTKSGTVIVRNGGAPTGSGGNAAEEIEVLGYTTDVANADSTNFTETLIVFDDPSQRTDALLIANTIGYGRLFLNNGQYSYDGDFLVILGSDYSY